MNYLETKKKYFGFNHFSSRPCPMCAKKIQISSFDFIDGIWCFDLRCCGVYYMIAPAQSFAEEKRLSK